METKPDNTANIDECPSCQGPFGGVQLEYPLHFDLRVIYTVSPGRDFAAELESALKQAGVPCTLMQGIVKPGGRYGRMGARVTVDSKMRMDTLYAAVSALPGVKAVI